MYSDSSLYVESAQVSDNNTDLSSDILSETPKPDSHAPNSFPDTTKTAVSLVCDTSPPKETPKKEVISKRRAWLCDVINGANCRGQKYKFNAKFFNNMQNNLFVPPANYSESMASFEEVLKMLNYICSYTYEDSGLDQNQLEAKINEDSSILVFPDDIGNKNRVLWHGPHPEDKDLSPEDRADIVSGDHGSSYQTPAQWISLLCTYRTDLSCDQDFNYIIKTVYNMIREAEKKNDLATANKLRSCFQPFCAHHGHCPTRFDAILSMVKNQLIAVNSGSSLERCLIHDFKSKFYQNYLSLLQKDCGEKQENLLEQFIFPDETVGLDLGVTFVNNTNNLCTYQWKKDEYLATKSIIPYLTLDNFRKFLLDIQDAEGCSCFVTRFPGTCGDEVWYEKEASLKDFAIYSGSDYESLRQELTTLQTTIKDLSKEERSTLKNLLNGKNVKLKEIADLGLNFEEEAPNLYNFACNPYPTILIKYFFDEGYFDMN